MLRSAVIAALLFASPLAAQQPEVPPQIITAGRAQATVPPDEAQVSIAVETNDSTATGAARRNAQQSTAVRQAMIAMGIPAASVTTAQFSVGPNIVYNDGRQRQEGYNATNAILVRTRALDQVGAILDAALLAGANRISSISFTSSRMAAARRMALTEAVQQARADAEAMAAAAGGSLGTLLEMSTTTPPAGEYPRVVMRTRADPTPITAGDISAEVSVVAHWRFVPR